MSQPTSQQDVVDILTTDHHEVLELIQQIKVTSSADERREKTDIVIAELMRHSVAEEMYVYPVMQKELPNGREAVEHDTAEHKQLEQDMTALEDLKGDADGFLEAIDKLEATLRDHVSDEENTQFPELRSRLSAEQLGKMGKQVEAAKKLAPTRPHPNSPNNQYFHKLVGPGVGMLDRMRDHLYGRTRG